MTGVVFAAIGALISGFHNMMTRKAVVKVLDAAVGALITVPISVPFFLLILIATSQLGSLISFSWQSYAWLSAAGVLHFVVGRSLNYNLIQLVGANIAAVVRRINPLVSVALGVSVLSEPFSWEIIVGALLIVFGVMLVGLNPQMFRRGEKLFSGIPRKAYLIGLGPGIAFGVTPIMIKLGLGGSGSPVAGAFISYLAATIVLGAFLWSENKRAAFVSMKSGVVGLFGLIGLFSAAGQLARYISLSLAPASVVAPIFATSPIFLLVFSFLFNRKLEVFGITVIIGIIAVVAGGILLV